MGRRTWESIPEGFRPLKNRLNIVATRNPSKYTSTNQVVFATVEELDSLLWNLSQTQKVFIIGGSLLYERYMGIAKTIYATVVDKDIEADTFFPTKNFERYQIESYSSLQHVHEQNLSYRYITYTLSKSQHGEHGYLNTLKDILVMGNKREDRTGTGTVSLFGPQLKFDISQSIPLLTTKFVPWKLTVKELLWFLKGHTDSKLLEEQNVYIWKGNTTRDFLDKRGLQTYEEGDVGSMYGWMWRHIGAEYKGCKHNYSGEGHDQLKELIDSLKTDPFSRRHLLTTYCPLYNDQGCLLPCHGLVVQFYVEEKDGTKHLSCHMYQRSSDTFLGLAINIASYSIMTYIIATMCDMKPKELIITTGDCHIYSNHLEQVQLQLSRNPLPFPVLKVNEQVKNKTFDELTLNDFEIIGYLHHPSIKADMAV
jgi:dihydrofolate reductase/thymidylate synthase